MDASLNWIKIAHLLTDISFGDNQLAEITVEGKRLCLGLFKGELFAFAPGCPHAGGVFSAGFIDVLGNVVCPVHRYKFSMKNGRNVSGEGYVLKRWPVEVRPEGVFVGLNKDRPFSLSID